MQTYRRGFTWSVIECIVYGIRVLGIYHCTVRSHAITRLVLAWVSSLTGLLSVFSSRHTIGKPAKHQNLGQVSTQNVLITYWGIIPKFGCVVVPTVVMYLFYTTVLYHSEHKWTIIHSYSFLNIIWTNKSIIYSGLSILRHNSSYTILLSPRVAK